jgi:hypothetical protein
VLGWGCGFRDERETSMKRLIVSIATGIVLTLTLALPAGASQDVAYANWRYEARPVLHALNVSLTNVGNQANANNLTGLARTFGSMKAEARQLAAIANSPDPLLNHDIWNSASAVLLVANHGLALLNGTGSTADFRLVKGIFMQQQAAFNREFAYDNVRYHYHG